MQQECPNKKLANSENIPRSLKISVSSQLESTVFIYPIMNYLFNQILRFFESKRFPKMVRINHNKLKFTNSSTRLKTNS